MVAIDDLLADKPLEEASDVAKGKTPVKLTWLKKARVLDDIGRKRISKRFSAELEELSGIVNLFTKIFSYVYLLLISQAPLLQYHLEETRSQSFMGSSQHQWMAQRRLHSRTTRPEDPPQSDVESPAALKK